MRYMELVKIIVNNEHLYNRCKSVEFKNLNPDESLNLMISIIYSEGLKNSFSDLEIRKCAFELVERFEEYLGLK